MGIAGPNDSMDWALSGWSEADSNTRVIEVDRSATGEDLFGS